MTDSVSPQFGDDDLFLRDADRDRIKGLVLSHPEVLALHDLRTRTSGRDSFIRGRGRVLHPNALER